MAEWPRGPFEVIESDRFLQDVIATTGTCQRWDEIKSTIDLDIARKPCEFEEVPGTALRAVTLLMSPARTLYFTVDEVAGIVILEALI